MIKWIVNTYYSWRNRDLMSAITEISQQYKRGEISQLAYRSHLNTYREMISKNLEKIRL